VRPHQDLPAALPELIQAEHELGALDGGGQLAPLEVGGTLVRFWQYYARELSDDAYGNYNFNWGYYLESLRLLTSARAGKPFLA
jgi:hypothetical protein